MSKSDNTLLEFKNVSFGYEPKHLVLKDISFSIKKGQHISIVGANGCGKSTLVKTIVGLFKPCSGSIIFQNKIINKDNVINLKKSSGIVFENPQNQFIGLTVEDEIAFGLENLCVPHEQMQSKIDNIAKFIGISNILEAGTQKLSGGQKQLVAIASVLVTQPQLIVFDEVTSMLDAKSKRKVNNIISLLKAKKNITIINITHNMEEAMDADRLIVMNNGQIILDGKPKDIFNSPKLKELSLEKPFKYQLIDKLGPDIAKRINYEK